MSAATTMSAGAIEATGRTGAPVRQLRRPRWLRRSLGSGRRGGPVGRAMTGVAAPSLGGRGVDDYLAAGRDGDRPTPYASVAAVQRSGWQLTDRGIALVLITGAVLLAAAVTVIAATAITVTSTDYVQPGHSAIAGR